MEFKLQRAEGVKPLRASVPYTFLCIHTVDFAFRRNGAGLF